MLNLSGPRVFSVCFSGPSSELFWLTVSSQIDSAYGTVDPHDTLPPLQYLPIPVRPIQRFIPLLGIPFSINPQKHTPPQVVPLLGFPSPNCFSTSPHPPLADPVDTNLHPTSTALSMKVDLISASPSAQEFRVRIDLPDRRSKSDAYQRTDIVGPRHDVGLTTPTPSQQLVPLSGHTREITPNIILIGFQAKYIT